MKNGKYEEDGIAYWYKDDVLHREEGHAVELPNGTKSWWVKGKRHRVDGPAIELADGAKEWIVDGQQIDVLAIFGYLPSVPLSTEEQVILRLSL